GKTNQVGRATVAGGVGAARNPRLALRVGGSRLSVAGAAVPRGRCRRRLRPSGARAGMVGRRRRRCGGGRGRMSGPIVVPEDTRAAQGLASEPGLSAWVSANAGSGKTHVLASRVMRLLLDGADPSRIL